MHLPQRVCHAGLVTQESCEVHRLAGVIPRPCLHLAPVPAAPLVGQEAQVSVPRGRELPVGLRTRADGGQSWGHSGENGWMVPTQRKELETPDGRSVVVSASICLQ